MAALCASFVPKSTLTQAQAMPWVYKQFMVAFATQVTLVQTVARARPALRILTRMRMAALCASLVPKSTQTWAQMDPVDLLSVCATWALRDLMAPLALHAQRARTRMRMEVLHARRVLTMMLTQARAMPWVYKQVMVAFATQATLVQTVARAGPALRILTRMRMAALRARRARRQ
jgi:hypothetical protein